MKAILLAAAVAALITTQAHAADGNELGGAELCTVVYAQEGNFRLPVNGCSPITPGSTIGTKQIWKCFATVGLCEQAATQIRAQYPPYTYAGCPFTCAAPPQ